MKDQIGRLSRHECFYRGDFVRHRTELDVRTDLVVGTKNVHKSSSKLQLT